LQVRGFNFSFFVCPKKETALTPRIITVLSLIKIDVCQESMGAYYKFILRTFDLRYNLQLKLQSLIFIGQ